MAQKANPISLRLIQNKNWQSKWFSQKNYTTNLLEDLLLKKAITQKLGREGGVNLVEINRDAQQIVITIHSSKPGVIIGRSGQGANELKKYLENQLLKIRQQLAQRFSLQIKDFKEKITPVRIKIEIMEIREPELCARLIAQNIATQLEKRIAYRRAVKQGINKVMQNRKIKGIRVLVAGRLGGVEIARREKFIEGAIPLGTFKADVDYAQVNSYTTYGTIGVKVWIYKQEKI